MSIIVTDENRAIWQQRLTEAENAMHKLLVGQSATAIGYDGESVSYKPAQIPQLRVYIGQLRAALGQGVGRSRPRGRVATFGAGFR